MSDHESAFKRAVSHISSSTASTSTEVKLEVYANYKMATTAVTPQSINLSRPGMFDFQGRAKYDAWTRYGGELEQAHQGKKSKDELAQLAKARYIAIAKDKFGFDENEESRAISEEAREPQREKTADELLDEDEEDTPPQASASNGGMSVSTMAARRDHVADAEREQTLHDMAARGDVDGIKALKPSRIELNTLDEYGFAPLHLAADKGHAHVVQLLLELGADVNLPDSEGMTASDTAEAVENLEIIELLKKYRR